MNISLAPGDIAKVEEILLTKGLTMDGVKFIWRELEGRWEVRDSDDIIISYYDYGEPQKRWSEVK